MRKILAMYRFKQEEQRQALEEMFDVISVTNAEEAQQIINDNQDIVAIASTTGRNVTENLIKSLPNLEIIANFGAGVDNIDLVTAKEREIIVTNTPDVVTNDTADTAMSLILNTSRRYVESDIYVRVGKWLSGRKPIGRAITGKTVGIYGMGRIGMALAKRVTSFDMNVAYTARSKKDVEYTYYDDLKELAQSSDFLIATCSLNDDTKHSIDKTILNALGEDGYLINVARGGVVHTEDLIWALDNNVIAGAGLDVFENEPFVPEELVKKDNVVLYPHMGAWTEEVQYAQGQSVLKNLKAYCNGEAVPNPVR